MSETTHIRLSTADGADSQADPSKKWANDQSDIEGAPVATRQSSTIEYPEGGLQAWLAVAGSAAVLFCTFGYINTFGYAS